MKILIIGSGISGLACANLLDKSKFFVEVMEEKDVIGGLIRCDVVDGFLYHRVGGHVFNSKNAKVTNWFWSKFDRDQEFLKVERNAKILLNNKYIGYPIENNLFEFDNEFVGNVLQDLLKINKNNKIIPSNFYEFLLFNFGKTLCDKYFYPYNKKIWQCALEEVALEWLEGKLPSPDLKSIILNNICRLKENEMVHSSFYYPVTGGSQFIVDRLSKGLKIIKNSKVVNINVEGNRLFVMGNHYDKIIYTGDIRKLSSIIKCTIHSVNKSLNDVANLKSHGTSSLLCECDKSDLTWLYLPEPSTKAHRIIYTGTLSISNNGKSSRSSCVVEFSGKFSRAEMENELKNLPGNLKPISHNYEENSYVIHDSKSELNVSFAINELNKINIYPLGRFAEWEYYNMDTAIESAMNLIAKF